LDRSAVVEQHFEQWSVAERSMEHVEKREAGQSREHFAGRLAGGLAKNWGPQPEGSLVRWPVEHLHSTGQQLVEQLVE
jgi:hypothetical protein